MMWHMLGHLHGKRISWIPFIWEFSDLHKGQTMAFNEVACTLVLEMAEFILLHASPNLNFLGAWNLIYFLLFPKIELYVS